MLKRGLKNRIVTKEFLETHVVFCVIFSQDGFGVYERRLRLGDADVGQSESGLEDFERPCAQWSLDDRTHEVICTSAALQHTALQGSRSFIPSTQKPSVQRAS
jgi:hypothetical protein